MSNSKALQRQEYILDLLERNGVVAPKKLAEKLNVSVWTIRRDLKDLESRGVLKRNYGAARLVQPVDPSCRLMERASFEVSAEMNMEAKRLIGQAAGRLVQPRERVALAGGTTTLEVAKAIRRMGFRGKVVTNALDIALEMSEAPDIHVICTGGDVQPRYRTLVGSVTERMLKMHYFDVAIVGVSGVSIEHGFTVNSPVDAAALELMVKHSCRTILVADCTKFGRVSFASFNPPAQIDYMVTNAPLPEEYVAYLQDLNVKLVIADQNG